MPPVSELYDIVVFGLLFVATAALANGLSVTPQMVSRRSRPIRRPPAWRSSPTSLLCRR